MHELEKLFLSLNPVKWSYTKIYIFIAIVVSMYAAFICLDFWLAKNETIVGTIIDETEDWSLKHAYRCLVNIETNRGIARKIYYGRCLHDWESGDKVMIDSL